MSKRPSEHETLLSQLDHLTDYEVEEVLDYVARRQRRRRERAPVEPGDDLLNLLSAAYENRRARQVIEWERVRRRAEVKASAQNYAAH
jgi:hypothetical protein